VATEHYVLKMSDLFVIARQILYTVHVLVICKFMNDIYTKRTHRTGYISGSIIFSLSVLTSRLAYFKVLYSTLLYVSEDAGFEPRTVAQFSLDVRVAMLCYASYTVKKVNGFPVLSLDVTPAGNENTTVLE
jgi:hypothetical protein